MSWQDRIQTAIYTSPSGATFEFLYEGVSVEVEKKTTEFTFPDVDGSFIQDLGRAGRKFPFTLFFSGEDHDLLATAFLEALEETGIGRLEHPLYGDRSVVPTGSITRVDNLTNEANQSGFSVVFSETITDIVYPTDIEGQEKAITDLSNELQENTSEEFAGSVAVSNISEGIALVENGETAYSKLNGAFEDFVKLNDDINASFIAVSSSLASEINNLLEYPASVMEQIVLLSRIPSQIETTINDTINQYKATVDGFIGSVNIPDGSNNPINDFLLNNSLVSGVMTSLCESVTSAEITTRPQAVQAAEDIANLYNEIIEWRDSSITTLGVIDTPLAYTDLLEVVTDATIYLIAESFNLPKEIRIKLQNDRNVIEFLASVGLDVESNFDDFIQWNDLTADDIEILEKGLEVVYYL